MPHDEGTQRLVTALGIFSLALGTVQLIAPDAMNQLIGANDGRRNRAVQRWVGGAREFGVGLAIESGRRPATWLWSRVAGDALDLGVLGTLLARPGRRPPARGRTGLCTAAVAGVTAADLVAALRLTRQGAAGPGGSSVPLT